MPRVPAAIYTRISRDAHQEGLGVERQEKACRERAEREDFSVVEVFSDNDISASTSSKKARPGYAGLLRRARAGEFKVILAYSNSRLTRRPKEWLELIDLSREHGVRIVTVASGSHDLDTADGRALALTVAAWDAAEAERTTERLLNQKRQRAEKGLGTNGRYRTYGYTRDWQVVEDEAAVIREAFERRAAEFPHSITEIAADFAARGLTTSGGSPWTTAALSKVLARASYAGQRVHHGEVIGKTAYPAIVSEDVFRAANRHQKQDTRGARRWLLTNFARCGLCSSGMSGTKARNAYQCNRVHGGCGRLSMKIAWLEDVVVSLVAARGMSSATSTTVTTADDGELQRIDLEIEGVRRAYADGDLALQDMTPILRTLREQRAKVEAANVDAVVSMSGPALTWATWGRATLSERRNMLSKHMDSVIVSERNEKGPGRFDPTRLTIRWTDGTHQRVSPDDLDGLPRWNSEADRWTAGEGNPVTATYNPSDPTSLDAATEAVTQALREAGNWVAQDRA